MSDDEKSYEVGYCKPPKATRFRKGQSGNPSGRPAKGYKRIARREIMRAVLDEADRSVPTSGGKMTMKTAVIRSLIAQAAKSHTPSMRFFIELVREAEKIFPQVTEETSLDFSKLTADEINRYHEFAVFHEEMLEKYG